MRNVMLELVVILDRVRDQQLRQHLGQRTVTSLVRTRA